MIEISLFAATSEWMAVPLIHYNAGHAPQREGLRHPSIAPYGAFAASDGREIVICIQNEREWARFCAEILVEPSLARDPRFADNPSRVANRQALDGLIAENFRRETREQIGRRLKAAEIAYGYLNSVADFARHPALSLLETPVPGGTVALPAPPGRDPATLADHAVPELDQHGAALRREFAG